MKAPSLMPPKYSLCGSQEGACFNGYYRDYCYPPLTVFAVTSRYFRRCGIANMTQARVLSQHPQKTVRAIRQRFGKRVETRFPEMLCFARHGAGHFIDPRGCSGVHRRIHSSNSRSLKTGSLPFQRASAKQRRHRRSVTPDSQCTLWYRGLQGSRATARWGFAQRSLITI